MLNRTLSVMLALVILSLPCEAESRKNKFWRVSSAVLGIVTITDMHSSYGYQELNPLLRSSNGQFGARGIAIKSAVVGTALGVQWLLIRKNPNVAPYAAGVNLAIAGATGAITIRNHALK